MAEAACIKALTNDHTRKIEGRDCGSRSVLENYPENFRKYLRAKTKEEAQRFFPQCCLLHLGMREQNKLLTAKLRNEEDHQDISLFLVFDLTDRIYDDNVIKYANDNLSLDESMKEQKQNPDFNALMDFIQVQLSECISLKNENIQLTDEITTKQGKPSGISVENWLSLPPAFKDKLQKGTEDEKKRLAIEYFYKSKKHEELEESFTEAKLELSKYKVEAENEKLQLKQQNNALQLSCQNQMKQIKNIMKEKDKLKADTDKQLKDSKSKLDKMTKDRDQWKKNKESFEKQFIDTKSSLGKMTSERDVFKKQNCAYLKIIDETRKEIQLLLMKNFEIQKDRAQMVEKLKYNEENIERLHADLHQTRNHALYYEDQFQKTSKHRLYLEDENRKLQQQLTNMARAKDDALNRLSKMAGDKLIQGNAGIADLSDPDRPTKLAEQFSELYDNQWSDSFEELEGKLTEDDAVRFLISVVIEAFRFCCRVIQGQKDALKSGLCELPSTDITVSNTVVSTKSIELDVSDSVKGDLEKLRLQVIRSARPNLQKKHFHVVVTHMLQKMLCKEAENVKHTPQNCEKTSVSLSTVVKEHKTSQSSDSKHFHDVDNAMQKGHTRNGNDINQNATEMITFRHKDEDDSISDIEMEATPHNIVFNCAQYKKQKTNSKTYDRKHDKDACHGPSDISQEDQVESGGQTLDQEVSIRNYKDEGVENMSRAPYGISQENQVEQDGQSLNLKLSIRNDKDEGIEDTSCVQNNISQGNQVESDERIVNPDLKKIIEILKGHDMSIQNERNLLTKSCCIFPSNMKPEYQVKNLTKSLSVLDRMTNENEIVNNFLRTLKPTETKDEIDFAIIEENYEKTYPMIFVYADSCIELCWKMRLQDPEVYMDDGEDDEGTFKHDKYKEYTRSGNQMDYVVWPALYLYKGGPMLAKGVAQPKMKKPRNC